MAAPVVTIVGGGPSGLGTAACLHRLSVPYTLLEREDCFAPLWQKYAYDRVHLHLDKQFCHLPLMPFPTSYPKYLSRIDFLRYLNDYVSTFEIRPTYRRAVEAAAYDDATGNWKIESRNLETDEIEEVRSRFLVVATGETCDPRIPEIEGLGNFSGEVLHSTRYKNGERFRRKNVLVVGAGNSGMEIALDLANSGAKASIVVRSPVRISEASSPFVFFHIFIEKLIASFFDMPFFLIRFVVLAALMLHKLVRKLGVYWLWNL